MSSTTPDSSTFSTGNPSTSNSSPNLFGGTGNPPILLIFLAVGLLAGTVLAMFVLRRVYPHRRFFGSRVPAGAWHMGLPVGGTKGGSVGEEPVLWDIWLEKEEGEEVGEWDSVLPLSAAFIHSPDAPTLPTSLRAPSPSHSHTRSLLKPFRLLHRGHDRANRPQSAATTSHSNTEVPEEMAGNLQVTVAIAMPQPEDSKQHGDGSDMVYCLGLAKVPWQEPEGDISSYTLQ